MPPTILNVVLGNGEGIAVKQESYYGDYEGDVTAIGGVPIHTVKDEPVSIHLSAGVFQF